ncbi:Replicase polyprotein 1a [Dirofilaria immitis]
MNTAPVFTVKNPFFQFCCDSLEILGRNWNHLNMYVKFEEVVPNVYRDPSPPPENELENHLNEIRIRTRKEIHTLLFLSKIVKEAKINSLKEQAAKLNEKDQQIWGEFISSIENKHEALSEEPKEYNNNKLSARLEDNPELVEAINRIKAEKVTSETTAEDDTFEFATKIERQLFSLIPGISGLTAYKNAMISEIAWDEPNTLIL